MGESKKGFERASAPRWDEVTVDAGESRGVYVHESMSAESEVVGFIPNRAVVKAYPEHCGWRELAVGGYVDASNLA